MTLTGYSSITLPERRSYTESNKKLKFLTQLFEFLAKVKLGNIPNF